MNKLIKTTLAVSIVALGVGFGPVTHADSKDDKTPATETRTIGAFSAIELAGPFTVTVTDNGQSALTLRGTRRQLDNIETKVENGTLVVRSLKKQGFTINFGRATEPAEKPAHFRQRRRENR
jgi:hypothetical protein